MHLSIIQITEYFGVFIIFSTFAISSSFAWNPEFEYNQYPYYPPQNYPNFDQQNYYNPQDPTYAQDQLPSFRSQIDEPATQSKCHCTKIRDCEPLMRALSEAPQPLPADFVKELRKKSCGYSGSEPLVCCSAESRWRRNSFPWHESTSSERPWVWDVSENTPRPSLPAPAPAPNQPNLFNRIDTVHDKNWDFYDFPNHNRGQWNRNKHNTNKHSKKKPILFDFEDPQTSQNCPPSFSDDFVVPTNYNSVEPSRGQKQPDIETNLIFAPHEDNIWLNAAAVTRNRISTDKYSLINSPNCGISIHARIIGGDDAGPGQFPWMARLAYKNRTSQLVSYRCSGSVISDQYVVTAAHCVTNLVHDLDLIYIRLGELDASTNLCDNGGICSEPQDFEIESVVFHEQYDSPKYANDIALIRLRRPTNSTFISPLCLPVGPYAGAARSLHGKSGIIAGWGASQPGSVKPTSLLQWLRLPIADLHKCTESYAKFSANSRHPIIVGKGQVCVQGRANQDACQGDSGGPLMMDDSTSGGRFTLIGLVSFGPRTCGISNFPGVYTRISAYMNWIIKNIRL